MKLEKFNNVYFIGIGGIGMSALARWFRGSGYHVAGYDRTRTTLTEQLEAEGMLIHYEDDVKLVPLNFMNDALIVYTPAIPADHKELNYFKAQGRKLWKRSEILGKVTEEVFTVAVAGTHGKTTTSSMIAHILKYAGKNVFAFVGGITQNYKSNLLVGDKSAGEQIMVVEADEYDRSFLRLSPAITVITAMDPDHLDIYKDEADFVDTFNQFAGQVKSNGVVFAQGNCPVRKLDNSRTLNFYGEAGSDFSPFNKRIEKGYYIYDLKTPAGTITNIALGVPGDHNVQNSIAAFAVGLQLGIPAETIKSALKEYKGVKRRFDYIYRSEKITYIDDYAHHPTEIKAFLSAVKEVYKDKKVTAIFQPHLFSRTRDFMDGFAESLAIPDALILLEIYPARELPIPGITSSVLLDKVNLTEKKVVAKSDLMKTLESTETDILVTIGAGDIDQFIEPIKKLLEKEAGR
ncbi:MAG: UDP-N-acetylmuramate--L-alanine ligase [Sporocytophaga sp.]|nr:UDP-N-acetylmuramate--L-alanine ligase [Sporocytophaga sp.]